MLCKDQLNREVFIPKTPVRIISLVPSLTELLYDLGLKDRIVGQTIFCIHPSNYFSNATKIGGTKKINLEKVRSLKPDLVIANKEENDKTQIEQLSSEFPVWISDVKTVDDALDMIKSIGEITDTFEIASHLIHRICHQQLRYRQHNFGTRKVVYLIWNEPYFAVGKNTFIDSMLGEAGFTNLISTERYPEISMEKLSELNPDFIFLSSEPFPFNEKHALLIDQFLQRSSAKLVDGELFSWYGSRMVQSYDYFVQLQQSLNSL